MTDYFEKGYLVGKINNEVSDYREFSEYADRVINDYDKHPYDFRWATHGNNKRDRCPSWEIESVLDSLKNEKFLQRWKEMPAGQMPDCLRYFENLSKNIISKQYLDLDPEKFKFNGSFSLYENDDFIQGHRDGANPGRVCVILIYISKEEDYFDGDGCLILEDTDVYEKVIPVRGNYVLLDFTKHNLIHSVNKVKNNFKRYCYINFVSI